MILPDLLQEDPQGLWTRLARARRPFLGLDYDGTLAPFHTDRMAARPSTGAREVLSKLVQQGSTRLAVISGRLLGELVQLLGPLPVTMVGSHGYERRDAQGVTSVVPLTDAQRQRLRLAREQAQDAGLESRLEPKAASLALHTRDLGPGGQAAALEQRISVLWRRGAEQAGLSCRPFDGGVELRAEGVDKGTIVRQLLAETQPDLAVYVGDDLTDEDAFRELQRHGGVGVLVGAGRPSAASARLPGCQAVVQFLERWLITTETARTN